MFDNASVHNAKIIQNQLQYWKKRGLYVFFLPPYSPKLNIAETLWRKIKKEQIDPLDYIVKDTLFYNVNQCLQGLFIKKYFIENVRLSHRGTVYRSHLIAGTSTSSATVARCDKTSVIYTKLEAFYFYEQALEKYISYPFISPPIPLHIPPIGKFQGNSSVTNL